MLFHTQFLPSIFTGKYLQFESCVDASLPKDNGTLAPMNDHAAAVLFFPLWLIAVGASWHKMKKVFFHQYLLPMDKCDVCHGCQECSGTPVCFALCAQACWDLQGDEKAELYLSKTALRPVTVGLNKSVQSRRVFHTSSRTH